MNLYNGNEIPTGLGMALTQNLEAMKVFASLGEEQRSNIISRSHTAKSKEEMAQIVHDLVGLKHGPIKIR
ncbi:MAG: hypothetical protein KHZ62_11855 [Clostridiales bacterium]|nr:hypothetical protein [Clostridiales bacterium]